MDKKRKELIISAIGLILLMLSAVFCYRTVRDAIVNNEKESVQNIAEVSSHSLRATLQGKSNLVYAALSGDMASEESIEASLLKIGEKGKYISLDQIEYLKKWEADSCEKAGKNPGQVIAGPIQKTNQGGYVLYLTKAVYMNRSIAGYVQIELNLDEIYEEEQDLSNLSIGSHGYCIVKDTDGTTIMADAKNEKEEIAFSSKDISGCEVVWSYEVEGGSPKKTQKLLAYNTVDFNGVQFVLCVVEDYRDITAPIMRIAFYLSLFGVLILVWIGIFGYRILQQQKEEEKLKMELVHEKELNEANEAMKNQENLMQKYNHSKTMTFLTGALAHEFNNLMTPIVLYSELLSDNDTVMQEMPEEVYELNASAKRCEELARQLLDYSRQGRAERVLSEYNATFAVESSISIVSRLFPENIKFETSVCSTPYYIKGQLGALNQIILNLVTNAIHAIGDKKGRVKLQFGLSVDDDQMVRLVIEDNGCGIPKELRKHVFDPFFTTKKVGEGNGIGLTVVKRMVEEHGGWMQVQSEEGKGTTFIMNFPRVEKSQGNE